MLTFADNACHLLEMEREDENDAPDFCRKRRREYHQKVGGTPEVRKHLEDLGFVPGGTVTVVTTVGGNLIVNIKESRVAISKEMASKIMI